MRSIITSCPCQVQITLYPILYVILHVIVCACFETKPVPSLMKTTVFAFRFCKGTIFARFDIEILEYDLLLVLD